MRNRAADDELMQSVVAGDQAAFAELMARHRQWVVGLLRAFVQDSAQAEDLAQEAFCRAHRAAAAYRAQGQFPAWLKRIAINVARDALRKGHIASVLPLELAETAPAPDHFDPMAALMSDVLREDVRSAIQRLPEEQRLAVIMRFFGDMSIQDIAWAMQCPEGTVKTRLFHSLRRIRRSLLELWEQEGEKE